jgi:hypothetical protein
MGCYTPAIDLPPLPAVDLPPIEDVTQTTPLPLVTAADLTRWRDLTRQQARAVTVLEQQRAADAWLCEGEVQRAADALADCRREHPRHAALGAAAGVAACAAAAAGVERATR